LMVQTFVAPEAAAISFCCDVLEFRSLLGPTPEELKSVMEKIGMTSGNVGMELGFEQRISFEINTYEGLKLILPEVKFVDAASLIWSQRLIKSKKEIECLRRACQATSYAHDHTFPEVKEGMTEREISQKVQKHMLDGGAEYPGFVIITSGKENYGRISKTSTDRKLEKGDMLWLDLGARYNGYWSDFCRAGIVGELSEENIKLQDKIHEITMEASKSMKPGVPIADVARECARLMEEAGFEATFDCGRMGHGMGLSSTEPPSVTIYDDTILQEGMIINLEPGVVNDSGVFDLEENFVITKDGCECLSGGSRKLHKIAIK
ncbi:MAG: M24 family metallopeptidase, partial [Fusobacterium sp.]